MKKIEIVSNWSTPADNVSWRSDHHLKKVVKDIRKAILMNKSLDPVQDLDVIQELMGNVPEKFAGPIFALGLNPYSKTGTVDDQYVDWANKNPNRLTTGDLLEPDMLAGPNRESSVPWEAKVSDVNWDHLNAQRKTQNRNFLSLSINILNHKDDLVRTKKIHKAYVKRLMSLFKRPKRKMAEIEGQIVEVKIIHDYPLTIAQQGAITHLFRLCGVESHPKAPLSNWFSVVYGLLNKDDVSQSDDSDRNDAFDKMVIRGGDLWTETITED